MPAKRVGHRKSRNGCTRCKARRVKCDEKRPCSNCVRHGVSCSLDGSEIDAPGSPTSPGTISNDASSAMVTPMPGSTGTRVNQPQSQVDRSTAVLPQNSVSGIGVSQQADSEAPLEFAYRDTQDSASYFASEWILSLRLFHHWCTSVYSTFSQDPETAEIWRNVVPEIAFTNELVLHSLLAISALHYGHTQPEERQHYLLKSAIYQNFALRDFSTRLDDINEANCEALFLVASCVFKLTMYGMSNPQDEDNPPEPSDVARFFIMVQGLRRILDFKPMEKWARDGPLAPLMLPYEMPSMQGTGSFSRRMDMLTVLAREQRVSSEVINPQSACLLAIESLRSMYAVTAASEHGSDRGLWIWIMSLPSLFIDMLRNNNPIALVILAHYTAVVRPYESDDWVFVGWSLNVLGAIERALAGQDLLLGYIAWPKRSLEEKIDVHDMTDDENEASLAC